ncbi:MAG TPA: DEAD/DEAH box helicase [Limnochordia bacterium]|nr:DEAD/DEAH box helicase [Limnochordia bacterium]
MGVGEPYLKALERMGIKSPTPIQAQTIPLALAGRDVLGGSHTGSGKTVAYGLPVLAAARPTGVVQALVVTPTRELCVQVADELGKLARFTRHRIVAVYGGNRVDMQLVALRGGAEVVVGTPGRLLDFIYRGEIDFGGLQVLVLDECDEMLNMGFIDDVLRIISCLPSERQTLLFSATLSAEVQKISSSIMREPALVRIESSTHAGPSVEERFVEVKDNDRAATLREVLADPGVERAIVFCRTKVRCAQLAQRLSQHGFDAAAIHGDMSQSERNRAMAQFKRGRIRILVATDVAARGIDVRDVTHVINYDCPLDPESYVHRVGRTARAGRSGVALTLVEPRDRKLVRAIERHVGVESGAFQSSPAAPATAAGGPAPKKPGKRRPRRGGARGRSQKAAESPVAKEPPNG